MLYYIVLIYTFLSPLLLLLQVPDEPEDEDDEESKSEKKPKDDDATATITLPPTVSEDHTSKIDADDMQSLTFKFR